MERIHLPQARPRLGFVSHMLGRHPGYVTTQGQILSDLFKEAGYRVTAVSSRLSRSMRLIDIVRTLIWRGRDIDILIIDIYGGPSFIVEDIASWIGRCFGQRVVMWLHGGAMPKFMARCPGWTQRVLRRADIIVAPSAFLARAVIPSGFKAQVIPNVIDLAAYPYRHRRAVGPHILWMRSFHPLYDPMMAVRVLARLRATLPEASLVMAGQDKGVEAEVRRLAQGLGLNGAVRFSGFLDMAGKRREGAAADIFLNTSQVDNMPVALVEACAMGLPVITTSVGGIPDLLTEGETGLLVPPNDEAMVEAIHRLLREPDLAERLSANGRRLAESSSWEQVRPQWERVFADLMALSRQNRRSKP